MRRTLVLILSLFIVQGFAKQQESAASRHAASLDDRDSGYRQSHASGGQSRHAGQWAVAIAGTPVYLALKTAVCSASLVGAAPTAAVIALADNPYAMGVDQLGDGIAANGDPPYVLSPS
ncbi:MAG: hypothetical protein OEU92_11955 [Alphaproteobacteria bacterium]|nr:hypothetical protein [Alphaproteobacteria bacterium]